MLNCLKSDISRRKAESEKLGRRGQKLYGFAFLMIAERRTVNKLSDCINQTKYLRETIKRQRQLTSIGLRLPGSKEQHTTKQRNGRDFFIRASQWTISPYQQQTSRTYCHHPSHIPLLPSITYFPPSPAVDPFNNHSHADHYYASTFTHEDLHFCQQFASYLDISLQILDCFWAEVLVRLSLFDSSPRVDAEQFEQDQLFFFIGQFLRHLFLVGLVEALENAGSRFAEETGAAVASEKGRLMSLQFGQLKLALADEGFFELILDLLPLLLNFGRKSAHFGTLAIYSLLKSVPLEAVVVFEFEEFLKFQVEFAVGRVGWIALLPEIGLEQTLLGVQVVANGVQLLLLQVGAVVFLLANAVNLGSKLPHILLVATRHLLILLNAGRGIAVDLFGLAVGHLAAKKQTSLHRRRIIASQYIYQSIMREHLEWKDNSYEPGLFTFYLEQSSIETALKLQQEARNKQREGGRGTGSEGKFKHRERYITHYHDWSQLMHAPLPRNQTIYQRSNLSERKIPKNKIKTECIEPLQRREDGGGGAAASRVNIQLKGNNLNSFFKYDINKTRTRQFVFRGQPLNFVRKESRKDVVKHQKRQERHMLAQSHTQRDSVEPSLSPAREEVTNSERGQVLNSRLKNTFLEFLIQRKKRLPKKEKSPSKPNPQLSLNRILQLNKPKLFEIQFRSKTER